MTNQEDSVIARLRNVIFSYNREIDLPKDTSPQEIAPDERTGFALQDINIDIPSESITVIMGPSGGGKSTVVRTFNAIIPSFISGYFQGDVSVLNQDVTKVRVSEMADTVGMVFQDYEAQLFNTSVETEVAFGPENLAVPSNDIKHRIKESLSLVGLSDLDLHREPANLSGGQKQRLVIASVLAMYPELLVLDEPTSDVDPQGTNEIFDIIESIANKQQNEGRFKSIVITTHSIETALKADKVVLLKNGQKYAEGPAQEIFTDTDALQECRVAVPPIVKAFEMLGWAQNELPLSPSEAVEAIRNRDMTWTPPNRLDKDIPYVPARTGGETGDRIFELNEVSFSYSTERGRVWALDDVDLNIDEGEFVAIIGPNGSGKTTLAKHLNGLLIPDKGRVHFRGRDTTNTPTHEIGQEVGYVFQNPDNQIFSSTVRDEVEFGPRNFGIVGEELNQTVDKAINSVEINEFQNDDPFTLSKGQRQRVALASVLATKPDAIVFDEPTTGMDSYQATQFMDMIARFNRDDGLTIIAVTHNMETVVQYSSRTIVLEDGEKVADSPTRDLFKNSEFLADLGIVSPQAVAFSNTISEENSLPALSAKEITMGLTGGK